MIGRAAWLRDFANGGGGVALIALVCLFGAGLISLYLHPRLSERSRNAPTHEVVKLATSMLVVMVSVVLGLLASSMSASFNATSADVRRFATDLILTDHALRQYGPDAAAARERLTAYTARALDGTWPADGGSGIVNDPAAAGLLDDTETAILALHPSGPAQQWLAASAEARLRSVLDMRWTLIAEAETSVSAPLVGVIILWLTLVFASFGYNAPRNRVVVATLLLGAASMAAAIFLIVELGGVFDGLLKVSSAPVLRALDYMRL